MDKDKIKFFVVLHGEHQYESSFVETPRKFIGKYNHNDKP